MLFIFAHKYEAKPFLKSCQEQRVKVTPEGLLYQLETPNKTAHQAIICGSSSEQIDHTVQQISRLLDANLIVLSGTAGALSPELQQDQLLFADQLLNERGQQQTLTASLTDHRCWSLFQQLDDRAVRGGLLTSNSPILSHTERLNQFTKTGAVAVDMEAMKLFQAVTAAGGSPANFSCIKIIADTGETADFKAACKLQPTAAQKLGKLLVTHLI